MVVLVVCCQEQNTSKKESNKVLFTQIGSKTSNRDFVNKVTQTNDFNCIRYTYALIGAGVAVGDVNNDGFDDIYLISNQRSNRLYHNQGNFQFEDITQTANVNDDQGWRTGVSMVDINNDGWLDIYVCKSASLNNESLRRNKLYINQKDGSFREEAKKWGLDHDGFSIQAYFFDYDKDGDLDMYLVNHRVDFENTLRIESKGAQKFFPETSDHLFRNDGHAFTNVTVSSKIINSAWGLSASIVDVNNDSWPDIYVANDYIAPDLLYINNQDGTFSNQINTRLQHISYNSMGSDCADINNDALPDLMVLEMSAEDHIRSKENMPTMNTDGFKKIVDAGYHKPYMANVLQLNNGNGSFSEIGQMAGISKTDWSWAPLIADFDNDGLKDVFISNGVERNYGNQDFARKVKQNLDEGIEMTVQEVINMMPSDKLSNYSYRNRGDLTFENTTQDWGFEKKINSNGIAYADFDNDGDLDLMMNNLSDTVSLYRNNSTKDYLKVKLIGGNKNYNAIGAKVKIYAGGMLQYQENFTSRGYLSATTGLLHFGLGKLKIIDKIEVFWNSGGVSVLKNIKPNQTLTIRREDGYSDIPEKNLVIRKLRAIDHKSLNLDYRHKEELFNDFSKQVLLPQKLSQSGPGLAVGDVNFDGLDDFYVGGAKNQSASLFVQKQNGTFERFSQPLFKTDASYEDISAHFFDADKDGDLDIYVSSGSYELNENDELLQDRLYINNGSGCFKSKKPLPKHYSNTKSIKSFDFDLDGDLDVFVGGHALPGKYPLASKSYILVNDDGVFKEMTEKVCPAFSELGMVNDMLFSDFDNDGDHDLWVVGEWFPLTLFENTGKHFQLKKLKVLEDTSGWWNTITMLDLDSDGDDDYLVGNLGKNNKFKPSKESQLHIYGNHFDDNDSYDMVLSKKYNGNLVPVRGKECSTEQNPFIEEKMPTFKAFANSSLIDIYGETALKASYHKKVATFASVALVNDGNGDFTLKDLPNSAQKGPTLSFELSDVNKDGYIDVLGIGAIHETEVETIPYNANTGYILLGSINGVLPPYNDLNFYNNKNAKRIAKILIDKEVHYLIANNNDVLTIFK